jgi:hypothetical protein
MHGGSKYFYQRREPTDMNCDLRITPRSGDHEAVRYFVTISDPLQTNLGSRVARYECLTDVETALKDAGWPEIADTARKTLDAGYEFSNVLEVADSHQVTILLKRS